ncbi:hypothetical protein MWU52_05770 [Jannaschia sp. S6380]|uniref:hypothetical protein n=1 Tax=Jannaschia sp. S6380 TaxID=2926408 RepID=UPI001FF6224A|nr:hypothetical protein [Jannaschia sp. S6380]MCK0167051.1 hypothetical protein [Jannaschia sp. S6380]
MVSLSVGLSIGSVTTMSPAEQSDAPEQVIKSAIKERHHIRAVRDGVGLLLQPYALRVVKGATILTGVVVFVDGAPEGEWRPVDIPICSLSGVEVYDETFIPSDAFDGDSLTGAIVALVDAVDPFEDRSESVASNS